MDDQPPSLSSARRIRWANFLVRLVGKGAPVPVGRLDECLGRAKGRRSGADDRKSVYDQLHGRHAPSARNAWLVGEALRDCGIPWSSGFLALFACDRLRDVCGVLGRLIPNELSPTNVERLACLIQTNVAATYVSALDFDRLAEFAYGRVSRSYLAREISRRRERDAAHSVWTLEPEMASLLHRGWERWVEHDTRALPFALQHAYRLATGKGVKFDVRESAVRRYIMQWLYTEIHPEPPSFSGAMLYEAILKAPQSNMANIARIHLLSEYHSIQEEVADFVWPGTDIPQSISNRLEKLRTLAPDILSNEDPMSWIPYDDYDLGLHVGDDGEREEHEHSDAEIEE